MAVERLKENWDLKRIVKAAAVCVSVLGYLFITFVSGANMLSMAVFFLAALFYVVIPGMAFADWSGIRDTRLHDSLVLLYGTGFLTLIHCLSVRLHIVWLLRIVPLAVSLVYLVLCVRKKEKPRLEVWENGVVLWALLCLFFALTMSAPNPHPMTAGAADLSRDMLWNVGNSSALSTAFPAEDIRFENVRFSYHYFTELLTAALHLISGASTYDITVFFSGPLFLAAELVALCSLGRCYYGEKKEKMTHAMVCVLFLCQCASMWAVANEGNSIFSNTMLKHLVTNINAQATALIYICVFLSLFTVIARKKFAVNGMYLLSLLAAFFVLTFSKGPQAAIILCAFVITMLLVLLLQKPNYGKAIFTLVGVVAIFIGIYQFLFAAGANNSMQFTIFAVQNSVTYRVLSPFTDKLCVMLPISGYVWLALIAVVNAFCMVPFQFSLWITSLPHSIRHLFQLDPTRILCNGVVVGGFMAYHLFYHSSSSQVYFALLSIIVITLLAVEQLPILKKKLYFTWPIWICLSISVITACYMIAVYSTEGIFVLQQTMNLMENTASTGCVTASDEEAMLYLKEHASAETVFATNRTGGDPYGNDGISNCYSGLSGVQAYMEGWTYAVTNMGVDQKVVDHKCEVNKTFFDADASEDAIRSLAQQEGVTCLVYAKAWPGNPPSGLTADYENEDVAIYFLS